VNLSRIGWIGAALLIANEIRGVLVVLAVLQSWKAMS
jgi:hypothetical protein